MDSRSAVVYKECITPGPVLEAGPWVWLCWEGTDWRMGSFAPVHPAPPVTAHRVKEQHPRLRASRLGPSVHF